MFVGPMALLTGENGQLKSMHGESDWNGGLNERVSPVKLSFLSARIGRSQR